MAHQLLYSTSVLAHRSRIRIERGQMVYKGSHSHVLSGNRLRSSRDMGATHLASFLLWCFLSWWLVGPIFPERDTERLDTGMSSYPCIIFLNKTFQNQSLEWPLSEMGGS